MLNCKKHNISYPFSKQPLAPCCFAYIPVYNVNVDVKGGANVLDGEPHGFLYVEKNLLINNSKKQWKNQTM